MTNTIAKPKFEEVVAVTTMNLPEYNLKFNAQAVGPTNFAGLRDADYGPNFKMPTMPQLIPLVYASLENRDYETAKNVVQTLRNSWLTGNTAIHYLPEGMFVEDNPDMKGGRIVTPSKKVLETRLGKTEEKGVVFSDDRSLRFTPYGFKRETQSSSDLVKNAGIVALAGSVEKAEMLAKSSEHYKQNPYFWALSDVKKPETRVAGLGSYFFDAWLLVFAVGGGFDDFRLSFGVFKGGKK